MVVPAGRRRTAFGTLLEAVKWWFELSVQALRARGAGESEAA